MRRATCRRAHAQIRSVTGTDADADWLGGSDRTAEPNHVACGVFAEAAFYGRGGHPFSAPARGRRRYADGNGYLPGNQYPGRGGRVEGLTNEGDVLLARRELEALNAVLPPLNAAIFEAQSRIAVLLGAFSGDLVGELAEPRPIPPTPTRLRPGQPIEVKPGAGPIIKAGGRSPHQAQISDCDPAVSTRTFRRCIAFNCRCIAAICRSRSFMRVMSKGASDRGGPMRTAYATLGSRRKRNRPPSDFM